MKKTKISIIILSVILALSLAGNIYALFFDDYKSYLQQPEEIYIMESGMIVSNREFREGEDITISYDFDNEEYAWLISEYGIDKTAGNGSEFDKAKNLMNEYSGRLRHSSNFAMRPEDINAKYLLPYSLDNKDHGINCRAKAQILNEMCLALGLYSRKLWLMPNSVYDSDCHVVNEVWDSGYNKWIMLDITNNMYWVDEKGTPLSVLEIREKLADQAFCTPVYPGDKLDDLQRSIKNNYGEFLYIAKNMVYVRYMDNYTVGETKVYDLMPVNLDKEYDFLISEDSVKRPPEK